MKNRSSSVIQSLVAVTVAIMFFIVTADKVPSLGWLMLIPLLIGFVFNEEKVWQTWIEGILYVLCVGFLFTVSNDVFNGVALVIMAAFSLFSNLGDKLAKLSKYK